MAALIFASCDEQYPLTYHGEDLIQFSNTSHQFYWAAALNPEADHDTLWLSVQTMGNAKDFDREIKIVQETATGWNLIYDKVGNVVDSIKYTVANQAVVGKHYVPFDDPGLKRFMVMPANTYRTDIPIVMRRDPTTETRLTMDVRLVETENTKLGAPNYTRCRITIE